MPATTMVHVRMDENVRLPFMLKTPNAETAAAIEEADEILKSGQMRFKNANGMFNELEKNSRK
jgi:antitoxin component of RelBE/YafQ-DinJ toxin-antitoxin module